MPLRDWAPILGTGAATGTLPRVSSDASADVLAIFGISGDLAKKMTFRALYRLEAVKVG